MKRVISSMTAVLFVLSLLLITMVGVAALGEDLTVADELFLDFTKEEIRQNFWTKGSDDTAAVEYDSEQQAVKITATDKDKNGEWKYPARFRMKNCNYAVSVDKASIFAICVKADKFKDNGSAAFKFRAYSEADPTGKWVFLQPSKTAADDAASSEWQLIYYDLKDAKSYQNAQDIAYLKGYYAELEAGLLATNCEDMSDHTFWVAWMGVFESVESAQSRMRANDSYVFNFKDSVNTKKVTAQYTGFSKGSLVQYPAGDTTIAHDADEEALKMHIKPSADKYPNTVGWMTFDVADQRMKIKEYPVLAMYVKGDNERLNQAGNIEYSAISATETKKFEPAYPTFGTDYTLVIVNAPDSAGAYNDGTYAHVMTGIFATYNRPVVEHNYWVKWVGLFKSEDAARAYVDKADLEEPVNTDSIIDFAKENNTEKAQVADINKQTVTAYDKTQEALKVTVTPKGENNTWLGRASGTIEIPFVQDTAAYPVFAVMIKQEMPQYNHSGVWSYKTTENETTTTIKSPRITPDGSTKSQWTLIAMDLSKENSYYNTSYVSRFKGNYEFIHLEMFFHTYHVEAPVQDYNYWIKWAGVFESVEAARAYFDKTNPEEPVNTDSFIDFAKENNTEKAQVADINQQTVTAYDKTQEALKVTVTPKGENNTWLGRASGTIEIPFVQDTAAYPVFAVMIKQEMPQYNHSGVWSYKTTENETTTTIKSPRITPDGSTKSQWTLIAMDLSKESSYYNTSYVSRFKGNYEFIHLEMFFHTKHVEAPVQDYNYWIKWAGVFESVEAAEEQFADSTSESAVSFFDFSSQETMDHVSASIGDSKVSWDAEDSSMKVEVVDGDADGAYATNTGRFSLNIHTSYTAEEYPVVAMRVKLDNPLATGGWLKFSVGESGAYDAAKLKYKETDEWQYILIDLSSDKENSLTEYFKGAWKSLSLGMALENFTGPEDIFHIKWIGLFGSKDEAMAKILKESPTYDFGYDDERNESSGGNDSEKDDPKNESDISSVDTGESVNQIGFVLLGIAILTILGLSAAAKITVKKGKDIV